MHALSVADRTIELHPRLTVINGLDDAQRAALADAVAAAVQDRTQVGASLIDELERAHTEVEAAETAARGLIVRRAARRRLQAARALERALLEGMGFLSYNEARLARMGQVIDLAAEERRAARPMPMVIDDAVVTIEADEVGPVLHRLLASNVQVIWLSDDPLVAAAATRLGADAAAVVEAGRSSSLDMV